MNFKNLMLRELCELICPNDYEICVKDGNFCTTNIEYVEKLFALRSPEGFRLAIVKDDLYSPRNDWAEVDCDTGKKIIGKYVREIIGE